MTVALLSLAITHTASAGPPAAGGNGKFKVVYIATKQFPELEKDIKGSGLFESVATDMNERFVLPRDVPIEFRECGESNAFYDPETGKISMCYELVADISEMLAGQFEKPEEADEAVVDAMLFFFFHEMGHCLIHIYDLPTTGKEEDAVDQLATLVLVDAGEDGEKAALDGAVSFSAFAEQQSDEEEPAFWDEHSMDQQRFYNIVCWVYGTDPEKYGYLVKDGHLPEARGDRCEGEYAQIEKSWNKLLESHFR
ncbi:MAG: DUF4344 domain-containing metallopeptidase [Acidobacteriota bacterium]